MSMFFDPPNRKVHEVTSVPPPVEEPEGWPLSDEAFKRWFSMGVAAFFILVLSASILVNVILIKWIGKM